MRVQSFFSFFFLGVSMILAQSHDALMSGSSDTVYHVESYNVSGIGIDVHGGETGINVVLDTASDVEYATGVKTLVMSGHYNNFGISGAAQALEDYTENMGVAGYAEGMASSMNIGVYGTASGGDGSTNLAGYFTGDVEVTGSCCGAPSDVKFKKNIRPLETGLDKIMALKPKAYEMKTEEFKDVITLAQGPQIGLIAQDVKPILPELVHEVKVPARISRNEMKRKIKKDPITYESMNYTGLIPVIVRAMQEQEAKIDSLEKEVQQLRARGER